MVLCETAGKYLHFVRPSSLGESLLVGEGPPKVGGGRSSLGSLRRAPVLMRWEPSPGLKG